mgnify:CR=1 FL=1
MKVAYPSSDCRSSSVLRSGAFVVVSIERGAVTGYECRRAGAEPPRGHGHHEEGGEHDDVEHARWHLAVLNALRDVDVVIAPHMGPTMVRALSSLGKVVVLGYEVGSPEDVADIVAQLGGGEPEAAGGREGG